MSSIGLRKAARIKAIHTACRANGIDEDTRRQLQLTLTGKASLKDMDYSDVSRVLDHINLRGKPGEEWRFVFRLSADRQQYARKIYRLAERVGALMTPPVPVASKAYIEGITRQMRGTTQPLEFCDREQLHKVIQALEMFVKRHGV